MAIPYLVRYHPAHATVRRFLGARSPVLTAHSLAETYSVLTRLPGTARLAPADASRLIQENFGPTALLSDAITRQLPRTLSEVGVAGGGVYDALVALAAKGSGLPLATRDNRALGTYAAIGVTVEVVPS